MSDQKPNKKVFGRGRGKPEKKPKSDVVVMPWLRTKTFFDSNDVTKYRPPRKEGEEFVLNDTSFPPLPGSEKDGLDEQFSDSTQDPAGTSQLDGGNDNQRTETEESLNSMSIVNENTYERLPEIDNSHSHQSQSPGTDTNSEKTESQTPPKKMTDAREKTESQTPPKKMTDARVIDVTNSNLSPFAVEFVPKVMNPEAQDFVPVSNSSIYKEANNNRSVLSSTYNVNDTAAILADLEETVNFCYSKLLETPALFDELIGVVTPHFIKYMENPELPNQIVQSLYSYAVQDTKFSYFAVKILIHLINITLSEDNTRLRDLVLRHAQVEFESMQNSKLMDPEINSITGIEPFLMFMSELYIQLEVGGQRLAVIGMALVETLKKLLASPHIAIKERLKLIVNISKLTGLSLDQDDPTFLDGLFMALEMVVEQESANLDSPTVTFVKDIILLRNLSWGFVEPDDLTEYQPIDEEHEVYPNANDYGPVLDPNMGYTSGVFYGPDGNPIPSDEQLFLELETNAQNHYQTCDQGEPSPTSVEDYDEAYEEFLKTVPGYHTAQ